MTQATMITPLSEPISDLTQAKLRGLVRRSIARGQVHHIMDLRDLTGLDTRTLSEIIRLRRWLREVGGSLDLITSDPDVLKILTISGLDRLFAVYPNEEQAVQAVEAAVAS